jgi:hypothetical protein
VVTCFIEVINVLKRGVCQQRWELSSAYGNGIEVGIRALSMHDNPIDTICLLEVEDPFGGVVGHVGVKLQPEFSRDAIRLQIEHMIYLVQSYASYVVQS